ncbi:MAG: VOC family protein [Chloroflexi bacterium]|nr:VOC family protein [Chloroflexota bacterium]
MLYSVDFDCERPSRLARFWADALGYVMRPYDDAEIERLRAKGIDDIADDPIVVIDPPTVGAPPFFFIKVPEPKTTKNRLHLDILAETSLEAEVRRLVGLGAQVLATYNEDGEHWTTLLDPEGNEFCVVVSSASG